MGTYKSIETSHILAKREARKILMIWSLKNHRYQNLSLTKIFRVFRAFVLTKNIFTFRGYVYINVLILFS